MAKQDKKNTSDEPTGNKANDMNRSVDQRQDAAVQVTTEGEVNNNNNQQETAPESLDVVEAQGTECDNQINGRFVVTNGCIWREVAIATLRREALEQLITDCELGVNTAGLTDDEVRAAIDQVVQKVETENEATQAEDEAKLSRKEKKEIKEVAKTLFATGCYEVLYLTSDAVPFKDENAANMHAKNLENKSVIKLIKSDF